MAKGTNEEILHALADVKETIDKITKKIILQEHARRLEALERKIGLTH